MDACTALSSGDCPIESRETIVYNMEMKIEPLYPSVSHIKLRPNLGPVANGIKLFTAVIYVFL